MGNLASTARTIETLLPENSPARYMFDVHGIPAVSSIEKWHAWTNHDPTHCFPLEETFDVKI